MLPPEYLDVLGNNHYGSPLQEE